MSEITLEQLSEIVRQSTKDSPEGEASTLPLDPACDTYAYSGYWIKVLKAEPKTRDFTPLHREHHALNLVHRQNRGTLDWNLHVPLPIPVRVDAGGELLPKPFLLMKAVKGEPLLNLIRGGAEMSIQDREAYGEQIGRYLARVHAIPMKGAGIMNIDRVGVHPGPWQRYYSTMIESQWKRLKGSGLLDDALLDRLAALTEAKRSLLIGETVNLSHNDFQLSNLFVDREKRKIVGMVNFQSSGAATPMLDLVSFHVHNHDGGLWEHVQKGYSNVHALPDKFKDRLVYYGYHFALWAAYVFFARKDEATSGYYLRRGLEAAAELDGSFAPPASRYAAFARPSV